MTIARKHNRPWSKTDMRKMRKLAAQKKSARMAARSLGRTPGSVKYKAMVKGVRFHFINQPRGVQKTAARRRLRRGKRS